MEIKVKSVIAISLISFCFMSCATSNLSRYTQSQISAMTMRNVDASQSEAFMAATDAMFDVGFTIEESDREGGILTGSRAKDQTMARIWVSAYVRDTQYKMTVLIRELKPGECSIRLSMSKNGEAFVDEKIIDEFWRLMKRQVLLKENIINP